MTKAAEIKSWRKLLPRIWRRIHSNRFIGPPLHVIRDTSVGFYRHDGFTYAASIAFYSILSGIAFLTLLFGAGGIVLSYLGYEKEKLLEWVSRYTLEAVPYIAGDLLRILKSISEHGLAVGLIGLVSLFITSNLIFGAVETTCERVFDKRHNRSIFFSHTLGTLVLFLGIFLLLAFEHILFLVEPFLSKVGISHAVLVWFVNVPLGLGAGIVTFLIVVRTMVPVPVGWRTLLVSGLTFHVLWRSARAGFVWYLRDAVKYNVVYGSLASLIILIIWVEYTAILFCWCVEMLRVVKARLEQARQMSLIESRGLLKRKWETAAESTESNSPAANRQRSNLLDRWRAGKRRLFS